MLLVGNVRVLDLNFSQQAPAAAGALDFKFSQVFWPHYGGPAFHPPRNVPVVGLAHPYRNLTVSSLAPHCWRCASRASAGLALTGSIQVSSRPSTITTSTRGRRGSVFFSFKCFFGGTGGTRGTAAPLLGLRCPTSIFGRWDRWDNSWGASSTWAFCPTVSHRVFGVVGQLKAAPLLGVPLVPPVPPLFWSISLSAEKLSLIPRPPIACR